MSVSVSTQLDKKKNPSAQWGALPDDLQDLILTRVPLPYQVRLRRVCRKWNSNLSSSEFLASCPPQIPWLPLFNEQFPGRVNMLCAFSPLSDSWLHISLSFLPRPDYKVATTGGGLILFVPVFEVTFANKGDWLVCNPLNKSFKKLPGFPDQVEEKVKNVTSAAIMVDKSTKAYNVLVMGTNYTRTAWLDSWNLVVYSSKSEGWELRTTVNCQFPLLCGILFCKGSLYLGTSRMTGTLAYNIDNDAPNQCLVESINIDPSPSRRLTSTSIKSRKSTRFQGSTLLEFRGQILLAGIQYIKESPYPDFRWEPNEAGIWQLREDKKRGELVAQMPARFWRMVLKSLGSSLNKDKVRFIGSGDLFVCVAHGMPDMIAYNLSKKSWRLLPNCVLPSGLPSLNGWYGCCFQPQLEIFA